MSLAVRGCFALLALQTLNSTLSAGWLVQSSSRKYNSRSDNSSVCSLSRNSTQSPLTVMYTGGCVRWGQTCAPGWGGPSPHLGVDCSDSCRVLATYPTTPTWFQKSLSLTNSESIRFALCGQLFVCAVYVYVCTRTSLQ